MSLYAFADEKRMPESKVYAADLDRDGTPEERKKDFYCPSPNCTARMRLRSKSVHCACFFALDGHSASCMYGHLNKSSRLNNQMGPDTDSGPIWFLVVYQETG